MKFLRLRLFGDLGQRSHICCLSTFSKGLFIKTAEPISFEFHLQPSSKWGKKV